MRSTRKTPLSTKPPAEVTITWPDKSQKRLVRAGADNSTHRRRSSVQSCTQNEEDRAVAECAPYTASFNQLLLERKASKNPQGLARAVVERMRGDGVPLNTETYNLLMQLVVRYTDGDIFELYTQLKAEGSRANSSVLPNTQTYVLLFRACERSADYARAFLLYEEMRETFGLVPDTAVYNTLLGFCAAVKDVAQSCYFVEEMKALGVPLDSNTYNCYMSVLVDSAPYAETVKAFDQMISDGSQPTTRTYNTLLRAMRVHEDFDHGFQAYEEMKKKGILPDTVTFNTLLCLCESRLDYVLGTGRFAALSRTQEQKMTGMAAVSGLALTLITEMQAVGVQPNTFSYNKVLSVLVKCEDPRVFAVFDRAVQAYPTHRLSSSDAPVALDTDSASGEAVRATLSAAMTTDDPNTSGAVQAVGVTPNVETERLIMRALLLFHHESKCKQQLLTDRARFDTFKLPQDLAILLLEACEKTLDKEWADEILAEVASTSCCVEVKLFNQYLAVLAAAQDSSLIDHFDRMKLGIHPLGVRANTGTYNTILRGCVACNKPEEGLSVFADMCAPYNAHVGEHEPNDDTYRVLVELYGGLSDGDGATKVVERAVCKQKEPPLLSRSVLHELLRLYARLNDSRIVPLFEQMKKGELVLSDNSTHKCQFADADTYAVVMEYYEVSHAYDDVARLFVELKMSPALEPNTAVYRVLVSMYSSQCNQKGLANLFNDARMNSVKLDISMYNTILESFVASRDPFVFEVLADMRENSLPPEDSTMAVFLASATGRQQLSEAVAQKLFYTTPSLSPAT